MYIKYIHGLIIDYKRLRRKITELMRSCVYTVRLPSRYNLYIIYTDKTDIGTITDVTNFIPNGQVVVRLWVGSGSVCLCDRGIASAANEQRSKWDLFE